MSKASAWVARYANAKNRVCEAEETARTVGDEQPLFSAAGVRASVSSTGNCEINGSDLWLQPESALALGRWLVEQFGELDDGLRAVPDPLALVSGGVAQTPLR